MESYLTIKEQNNWNNNHKNCKITIILRGKLVFSLILKEAWKCDCGEKDGTKYEREESSNDTQKLHEAYHDLSWVSNTKEYQRFIVCFCQSTFIKLNPNIQTLKPFEQIYGNTKKLSPRNILLHRQCIIWSKYRHIFEA